ncbi:MAG: hypothetical protein ACJ79H_07395 [Myxococcales bacterium]
MINRQVRPLALPTLLALALCGCASAEIKSNKSPGYSKKLDRLLIVFPVSKYMQEYEPLLKERMVAELQKRGVAAVFAKMAESLALEDAPSVDAQAKDFNASNALLIRSTVGVITDSDRLLGQDFDAQLFDLASKTRVWRAEIRYNAGGSLNSTSARVDTLIGELVKTLSNDGLL